ncbi:Enoyl-CoA hydratase [Rhodovulum sp. PH10]|uniref:enoyl-CoA hydratase/isomerase family protein n=1 Tax=Rhodovulum sp. PH10 TaxID=1187851 RepID=UPI00027C29C2|nr:enoyl-CoA hydratase/isomerase family protein [Rhodovulum sp. PH10]EJW12969.1 Enoyl-CoA hydratase [Rhodovulum sp. PH10]
MTAEEGAPAEPVLCTRDPRGVVTLTLARPDKGNAYDRRMVAIMAEAVAEVSADPSARALVLRGQGRHFSVGGDIFGDPDAHAGGEGVPALMPDLCLALDACPKPTVALVHGACVGGGFALAACCDVLLAADDAFFAVPELRLGFAVAPYVPLFERALGARALRRLLITGERILADEALRLGVAHAVHEKAEAEAALEKTLDAVLLAAPAALAAAKRDLRALSGEPATAELLASLHPAFHAGFWSEEGREGRAAFLEKRRPAWAPAKSPDTHPDTKKRG